MFLEPEYQSTVSPGQISVVRSHPQLFPCGPNLQGNQWRLWLVEQAFTSSDTRVTYRDKEGGKEKRAYYLARHMDKVKWLHSLQSPGQNENTGPFFQKAWKSLGQPQQSINKAWGPTKCRTLCDPIGHTPMKLVLLAIGGKVAGFHVP